MKSFRRVPWMAGLLALWIPMVPLAHVQAAQQTVDNSSSHAARSQVRDVELGLEGQLSGQVTNVQGQQVVGQAVMAIQDGRQVSMAVTDDHGRFQLTRLHGGLFQVVAGPRVLVCRGWANGTAPPVASRQLLLVTQGVVERGQRPFSDLFFADPIMVGLVIAAAVAIPIAVSNSRSESPPGS